MYVLLPHEPISPCSVVRATTVMSKRIRNTCPPSSKNSLCSGGMSPCSFLSDLSYLYLAFSLSFLTYHFVNGRFKDLPIYTHATREAFTTEFNSIGRIMEKVRFVSDQIRSRKYCYSVSILPTMSNVAPGITGAQLFLKAVLRWMKANHPEHLIKVLINTIVLYTGSMPYEPKIVVRSSDRCIPRTQPKPRPCRHKCRGNVCRWIECRDGTISLGESRGGVRSLQAH